MSDTTGFTAEQLHVMREDKKAVIELRNALLRLLNTKDFQTVFMQGYCEDEAIRLTHLLGDPSTTHSVNKAIIKEDLIDSLSAIAKFSRYVRYIEQIGLKAQQELDTLNQTEATE